jgi:methyl-accepting chemotaxis protein
MSIQNLTLAKKMILMAVLVMTPMVIFGIMTYRTTESLATDMKNLSDVQMVALREMVVVDMYHDTLRAVVSRAIIAAQVKDEKMKGDIAEELKEYTGEIKSHLDKLDGLAIPKETDDAIAASRPELDAYIKSTEELTNVALSGQPEKAVEGLEKFEAAFEALETKLAKLSDLLEDDAKKSVEKGEAEISSAKLSLLFVFLLNIVIAVVVFSLFNRTLTKTLRAIAGRIQSLHGVCITNLGNANDALAVGDLEFEIVTGTQPLNNDIKDELGNLARGVDGILAKTKLTIAGFEASRVAIRNIIDETRRLTDNVKEGRIDARGNASKFRGAYGEIVNGINEMMEAVATPLNEASDCLQRVARRDLTAQMTGDYKGDFATIKEALNTALANLDEGMQQIAMGAEQVTSAATEISSGSQSLAQGASEQASTLEEISSNLQEISSMTKQNASNSKEARSMSDSARLATDGGMRNMKRLSEAVEKIKDSSDSTAKIVKTIEEIAFQTNLLALNAAVEAARAGDAGKGFAVVAEEVRNLAMRSAEAAQTTAQLIDEAVKNTESGVSLNAEVSQNLEEINAQIEKVSVVMAEIAAASEQQNQGVEQINVAVEQMNGMTQMTAANSEESASAAEELSGQSQEMLGLVNDYKLSNERAARRPQAMSSFTQKPATVGAGTVKTSYAKKNGRKKDTMNGFGQMPAGDSLIPFGDMDDNVLSEF